MRLTRRPLLAGLALACAWLALPAGPAAAQEGEPRIDTPYRWIPHSFRVGLVGGHVEADRGRMDLGPGSSVVGGGRLRLGLSNPISLGFTAAYGRSERLEIDPRSVADSGLIVRDSLRTEWILAEAEVQFALTGRRTWHGLQPYLTLGAGFLIGVAEERASAVDSPEFVALEYQVNAAPVLQVGAGVEWLVSDRFGIGVEVRDHLWRIKTPEGFFGEEILDGFEAAGLPAPEDTEWPHNLELSVSLWRYF